MKQTILIALLFLLTKSTSGQEMASNDSISVYYKEIESTTEKYYGLWDKNLYGPILLVEPETRQVFANEADTAGILKPTGSIYTGTLPEKINIANTAINWGGKRWAMILLPLPQNKQDRINLMAHELFHKAQPSLGFTPSNTNNNHLDQKEGRIFLRLELEALKKAVQSSSGKERYQHLIHALSFRKYRHSRYPGSDTTENALELNEGMAEFTGAIMSGRNEKQMVEHFVSSSDDFFSNPTYVRSFAYETIPVYGYLLYRDNKNWAKGITAKINLTTYFIDAFNIDMPINLKKKVESISDNYNGKIIIAEETARAEKNKKRIAEYKKKFIEQPHFEIPVLIDLKELSVSFDPRRIIPVGDEGTVYPRIRVTDLWGSLTVENGALITPDWARISIANPTKIEGKTISGEGWTLELADGYSVEKDETSGNYILAAEKDTGR